MAYETLIYEKKEGIATITLNRPERLNAINYQLAVELDGLMAEVEDDPEARVVILTGAGKGFCAGADIKAMADPSAKPLPVGRRYTFFNRIEDMGKPVIAAINGACNGGGLEIALCCDFRIASEEATFGLGEVKLGVIPAAGGTARLPRLIGIGLAKEFLYFGNRVGAQEALRIGMINKVVPPGELLSEANQWAAELCERPPLSLKALKYCVNVGMQMDLASAVEYEAKQAAILTKTEDVMEGMMAFVEKRKPVFKGK
ncbi:MAG: enoyl-CoA hydratase/isomerase family protein [Deltaproteobacteria bacterium]|nr:enoyl-CoA hydratase/isomerase family protein [Deltaproteobacteria bacterium]